MKKEIQKDKNNPMYGKHHTEETKKKMSLNHADFSGKNHPMYGKHHTEDAKRKMALNCRDVSGKNNPMYGTISPMRGKNHTQEAKQKISEAKKDKPLSGGHRKKLSDSHKGKNIGKDNPFWKGDDVCSSGLHYWIRKYKSKPEVCEMCNHFEPKHLSNITGEYKRDINDFQWLCVQCHSIYDNQIRGASE